MIPAPLHHKEAWCRSLAPLVDLDYDEEPLCRCGVKAEYVTGFGQGNGEEPKLVCVRHARAFCRKQWIEWEWL